jgi:hypothetical protein
VHIAAAVKPKGKGMGRLEAAFLYSAQFQSGPLDFKTI